MPLPRIPGRAGKLGSITIAALAKLGFAITQKPSTNPSATGLNAIAVGESATAAGDTGIAIGEGSSASGTSSVAIGDGATASSSNAIAIGDAPTQATGLDTIAIGNGVIASATGAVGFGNAAQAVEQHAVALGNNAQGEGVQSIAIGGASSAAQGPQALEDKCIAIGADAVAGTTSGGLVEFGAIAIGRLASASVATSLALGYNASASAAAAIAIGDTAAVSGGGSIGIGDTAQTASGFCIAIGSGAQTDTGIQSIAIGNSSYTFGVECVAIGNTAFCNGDNAIAVGDATAGHAYAVAIGSGATSRFAGDFALAVNDPDHSAHIVVLKGPSIAATTANLQIADGTEGIPIVTGHSWAFTGVVVARDSSNGFYASYSIKGLIERSSTGTVTLLFSNVTEDSDDNTAFSLAISGDDTNKKLQIAATSTGVSRWTALLNMVRVD